MSNNICKLIHITAFATVGYIDRVAAVYGLTGFVLGLIIGTSICSTI